LIELLVVIGIIALLMGMLLPALSRAREQSRTVHCLANLRSVVLACLQYSADNHGCTIPAGWGQTPANPRPQTETLGDDEMWCNILVNSGYASAPDGSVGWTATLGPQRKSIFFCPSGRDDVVAPGILNVAGVPSSRVDDRGAEGVRFYSFSTRTSVDCWYGINGSNEPWLGGPITTGTPTWRVGFNTVPPLPPLGKMTQIRRASEMIFFFDGIYFNYSVVEANRVNARHAGGTKTNLAFFDGHAATYETATLPGGRGVAQLSDFSAANLKAKFPSPPNPMWLLEQQD
jgi:prepilin-type processing-associated H-X9-DG protein